MTKNRKILLANIILAVIFLISLIFALSVYLSLPFPERTRVDDMDSFMIQNGQAFALTSYVVCIPIAIITLITTQILTIILIYRLFVSDFTND